MNIFDCHNHHNSFNQLFSLSANGPVFRDARGSAPKSRPGAGGGAGPEARHGFETPSGKLEKDIEKLLKLIDSTVDNYNESLKQAVNYDEIKDANAIDVDSSNLPALKKKVKDIMTRMEDHFGDMDFKVAGTRNGITALQMDIKIAGINAQIMAEALEHSRNISASSAPAWAITCSSLPAKPRRRSALRLGRGCGGNTACPTPSASGSRSCSCSTRWTGSIGGRSRPTGPSLAAIRQTVG